MYFPRDNDPFNTFINDIKENIDILVSPSMIPISSMNIQNELTYLKKESQLFNLNNNSTLKKFQDATTKMLQKISEINSNKINNLIKIIEEDKKRTCEKEKFLGVYCHNEEDSFFLLNNNPLLTNVISKYHIHLENIFQLLLLQQKKHNLSFFYKPKIFEFSKKIKIHLKKNEQICFVCNNNNNDLLKDNRTIYECISCSITVHQICYGIDPTLTDISNWTCDSCESLGKERAINLECLLCPVKGGAMKESNFFLKSQTCQEILNLRTNKSKIKGNNTNEEIGDITEKAWIHITCVLWNTKFSFDNFINKENIICHGELELKDIKERCQICSLANSGPVIKCKDKSCQFKCHPECARINNCYLEIEEENENKFKFNVLCFEHQRLNATRLINGTYNKIIKDIKQHYSQIKSLLHLYSKKDRKISKSKLCSKIDEIIENEKSKFIKKINSIENLYYNKK